MSIEFYLLLFTDGGHFKMQKCNVSRYAVGLCYGLVLLIFSFTSTYSFKLNLAATHFLGIAGNPSVNLRYALAIDRLILNGHEFPSGWTRDLLDPGQIAQLSAAESVSLTSHLAAFGVKR